MKREIASILIVENNPNERLLMKEALQELRVADIIYTANDGEEAIGFLKGQGRYGDRQTFKFPGLMLTDLDMPKINGFELLRFIKRSKLIIVPTIVFTASSDPNDIQLAYELGAHAFHTKPAQLAGFLAVLKNIYDYWVRVEPPDVDENGNLRVVSSTENITPFIDA